MIKENLDRIRSLTSRDNKEKIKSQETEKKVGFIDPYEKNGSMIFETKSNLGARLILSNGLSLPLYGERPLFTNDMISHRVTQLSSWNKVRRDQFADFMRDRPLPVYYDRSSGLIGMMSDRCIEKVESMFFSLIVERLKWLFLSTWRYGHKVSSDWEDCCHLISSNILNLVKSYGGKTVSGRYYVCGHLNITCHDTISSFNGKVLFSKTITLPSIFGEGIMVDISSHRVAMSYAGHKLRKWWAYEGDNYSYTREEKSGDWSEYSIVDHAKGGGSYMRNYQSLWSEFNISHSYLRDPVAVGDPKNPKVDEISGNRCFPRDLIGWTLPPSPSVEAMGLGVVSSVSIDDCYVYCVGAANQAVFDMDVLVRQYYAEKGEPIPEKAESLGMVAVASRRKPSMTASLNSTAAYRVCDKLEQKKQFLDMEYAKGIKFRDMPSKHAEFLKAGLRQMTMLPMNSYMTPLEGVVNTRTLSADMERDSGRITYFFHDGSGVHDLNNPEALREWIQSYNDGAICTFEMARNVDPDPDKALKKVASLVGMSISSESNREYPEMCKEIMEFYDAMDRWHCLFYMDILGVGLDMHNSFASHEVKLGTSSGLDAFMELLIESIMRWGLFDENQRTAKERDILNRPD